MPVYRNLWEHIGKAMPKKGRRANAGALNPLDLPLPLQTAFDALYGHYERVFDEWQRAKIDVPPCFIVVCNTATSKLVYDYIAGFHRQRQDGSQEPILGRLAPGTPNSPTSTLAPTAVSQELP